MELFLQFGHGMMSHAKQLLADWDGGGVVLSPRDLTEEQLNRISGEVQKLGGTVLFDPQCYIRDSDHKKLTAHEHWTIWSGNSTGAFLGGPGTAKLLKCLAQKAKSLGTKQHILPAPVADVISEDWFTFQENIISEAPTHFGSKGLFATLALSDKVLLDEEQIEAIVEQAEDWPVAGFYVVGKTPNSYLIEHPVWLSNLMILVSGLKLSGKKVIVGYSNHQYLCLAASGVDTICSGTFLNVRSFNPDKFYENEEGEISRRSIWYYCPQALSEYKLPFLDTAKSMGVLDTMKAIAPIDGSYAQPLFSGPDPSTINWGETNAFRHYLTCLHGQASVAVQGTFEDTVDFHLATLDEAEKRIKDLRKNGVFGGDREFKDYLDVNRSALALLRKARGAQLRRNWPPM